MDPMGMVSPSEITIFQRFSQDFPMVELRGPPESPESQVSDSAQLGFFVSSHDCCCSENVCFFFSEQKWWLKREKEGLNGI